MGYGTGKVSTPASPCRTISSRSSYSRLVLPDQRPMALSPHEIPPAGIASAPSPSQREGCRWNWCLEGQRRLSLDADGRGSGDLFATRPVSSWSQSSAAGEDDHLHIRRSSSQPTISARASTPLGSASQPSSPFHGVVSRRFGLEAGLDLRMSGGAHAKMGFAGTRNSADLRVM